MPAYKCFNSLFANYTLTTKIMPTTKLPVFAQVIALSLATSPDATLDGSPELAGSITRIAALALAINEALLTQSGLETIGLDDDPTLKEMLDVTANTPLSPKIESILLKQRDEIRFLLGMVQ